MEDMQRSKSTWKVRFARNSFQIAGTQGNHVVGSRHSLEIAK